MAAICDSLESHQFRNSKVQTPDNVDYKPLIRDSHVTMVSFEQKLLKDFEDRVNKNEKNHL